jgi:hypothetical protein
MIRSRVIQYLCLIAPVLLLFGAGCSKNDNSPLNPPVVPTATWQATLPNLVLGDSSYFPISVQVNGIQSEQIDSVACIISNNIPLPVAYVRLYDDGSAYDLTDNLTFASLHSGDNVPHDGIFSRSINSFFTLQSGTFTLQTICWIGNGDFTTPTYNISVSSDAPPIVSNLSMPDSLLSGFAPVQINIQAIDPDSASGDHIAAVQMRLYNPSGDPTDSIYSLIHAAGSAYNLPLVAAFAAGHPTGNYTFSIYAYDTYNLHSDTSSQTVYMENLPPHLTDVILPDTIVRPIPGDTTYFPIMVRGWDDQGAGDINSVVLQALKPDLSWGPVVDMFDNGNLQVYGDSLAGDSVYTRVVSIWPSNLLGLYQFHFRSTDHAGNQNEIIDSLWVVP